MEIKKNSVGNKCGTIEMQYTISFQPESEIKCTFFFHATLPHAEFLISHFSKKKRSSDKSWLSDLSHVRRSLAILYISIYTANI